MKTMRTMSVAVANAAGKFEQREVIVPPPKARTEPASAEERPWWVAPELEESHWSTKKPGSSDNVFKPIVDDEFAKPINHSPKAQAFAKMTMAIAEYEALGGNRNDTEA